MITIPAHSGVGHDGIKWHVGRSLSSADDAMMILMLAA
jgi:hypothetical protein